MSYYLAVDFGGTRTRAAVFDADCRMVRRAETSSQVEEGPDKTFRRLTALGRSLIRPAMKLRQRIFEPLVGPEVPGTGRLGPQCPGWVEER